MEPMPANVSTGTQVKTSTNTPQTSYLGPLAILTTLFFMWGSLTSLNDVLIPYAQHVFNLNLAKSMLIQTVSSCLLCLFDSIGQNHRLARIQASDVVDC